MHEPRSLLILAFTLLFACAGPEASRNREVPAPPAPAPAPIRLTLVGTNDIHGWVYPKEFRLADGTAASEGGLATFSGYLSILRRQHPNVLLLDGGDLFQGTLPSNLSEGAVVIDAMNHLGYAAAALGNHEFDYGPVGPSPVALRPDQDSFGALKARIQQARFPILAVNVQEAASGAHPGWLGNNGTRMMEVEGLKIGIVGLATPHTPSVTNPVNVASLRFTPLAEEAIRAAAALRARGAVVVIAVMHAGGRCARWDDPRDLSSCDPANGEIFGMFDQLPEGTLDAVVAGHTHAPMGHFIKGTPVVETPGLGRSFSMIELFVDPVRKTLLKEQTRITPVVPICATVDATLGTCDSRQLRDRPEVKLVPATFLGEPVVVDTALETLVAPAQANAQSLQQRSLGVSVPQRLTRNYEGESPLGLMLADTLRENEKADLAILNPGGLRADLAAGELKYGDVFEVLPFDNTVATVTLTGTQLSTLFKTVYGARKGVFQVSGARLRLARCKGPDRLLEFVLDPTGKPPRPTQTYRVVMPDFLARGGDGLGPFLESLPPGAIDLGEAREDNFRDVIVNRFVARKAPVVAPKPGRIVIEKAGADCGNLSGADGDH